jgi:predicted AAA+ superfamily ATPase
LAERYSLSPEKLKEAARSQMERWQYIQRGVTTSELKKIKERGSNVISIRGARRVGKTTLVAHVFEKALFIDCKVLD